MPTTTETVATVSNAARTYFSASASSCSRRSSCATAFLLMLLASFWSLALEAQSRLRAVAATNAAAIRAFLGCMLLIMLCVTLGMGSAHFTAIYLLFIVGVPVYMKRR